MKILVLAGGESQEREVSLNSGKAVAAALQSAGHTVQLLDTRDGRDLLGSGNVAQITAGQTASEGGQIGRFDLSLPATIKDSDVVFIALHGGLGENGTLQALFDLAKVAYTGSGVLASALAMDKQRAKLMMDSVGVPTPQTIFYGSEAHVFRYCGSEDFADVAYPIVVKPNSEGSTVGITIAKDYAELLAGVKLALDYDDFILLEEYIPGRELTVAVLGDQALPVVEIVPKGGFYDYEHKYTSGASDYICPAVIDQQVEADAKEYALTAFQVLGCSGYARADFRLNPQNQLFCLEVNTLPGMTSTSLVPKAAKAAGISFEQLLNRIVELALKK